MRAGSRRRLVRGIHSRATTMNTPTTFRFRAVLAIALAGGLVACGDKPAPADAVTQDAAPATTDAAPTARELVAAPHGAVTQGSAAAASITGTEAEAAASADADRAAPRENAVADDAATAPRYANVVSVQPVKRKVSHPREECRDERVVHRAKPKDQHQVAGTVIGAIAGGVIGNQVGRGRGRDAATVAGAIGGGYAGKKIQQDHQRSQTYTTVERRCRTIDEPADEVVAYDVVYEYLGTTQKVRLDHDPGDRVELPVRGIE